MEEGAGNSHSSSGPLGKTADVRLKRSRRRNQVIKRMKLQVNQIQTHLKTHQCVFQNQRSSSVNRNAQGKVKKRERRRRRKGSSSRVKGDAEGPAVDSLENSSVPTPAGMQRVDLHEGHRAEETTDPKMVHKRTQTWHREAADASTQTLVVCRSDQDTQTEEQSDANVTWSDAVASPPQVEQQKNPGQDSAQAPGRKTGDDGGSPNPAESPSVGTSCGDGQKMYAMVVSAGGEAKRQAAMDTSEAPREPSEPPQTPR